MTIKKVRKVKKGEKKVVRIPDRFRNELICTHYGEDKIEVKLKLNTERRKRNIGTIFKKDRILFVRRNRLKHLHRKSRSYGFMYLLIKEGKQFDNVRLMDELGSYLIPKKVILESSEVMNFKNSKDGESYELQYFLSMDIIEKYMEEAI
jgi:hypothetical protein